MPTCASCAFCRRAPSAYGTDAYGWCYAPLPAYVLAHLGYNDKHQQPIPLVLKSDVKGRECPLYRQRGKPSAAQDALAQLRTALANLLWQHDHGGNLGGMALQDARATLAAAIPADAAEIAIADANK